MRTIKWQYLVCIRVVNHHYRELLHLSLATTEDLRDEDFRRIPTSPCTEKSITINQRPPLDPIIINELVEEETVKSSQIRRLFCTSISCREWVLIGTI